LSGPDKKAGVDFMAFILEGIVTTLDADQRIHIAPMGPATDNQMERLVLRPFKTAQTYRNLKTHSEGVFHITDDVLLLARAALGKLEQLPPLKPASHVRGSIIVNACRFYEFRIRSIDDSADRSRMEAEVVHFGRLRDFTGFNRAKHAVVEAAILATRTDFLPLADIQKEFQKLSVIVQKTGEEQETAAFAFLLNHLDQVARQARGAYDPRSVERS
jgi:hypothetical protein